MLQLFPNVQIIANNAEKFPVNGQIMFFWAMVTSIALYFIVSALTCKQDFNMERMLHRGKYAIADDKIKIEFAKRWSWGSIIGIDEHFTRSDKAVSASVFGWTMFWWIVFIVVTLWNLFSPWPLSWWSAYWHYYAIIIPLVVSIVTTVWFLWGGITDLRKLYIDLRTYKSDASDDGTVTLAEEQALPDNYIDAAEAENGSLDTTKPYPGKPSKMY